MALLTKFLGNYHSFHRLHRPHTHSQDSSTLLRHNEHNPICSTTGHTPIWTDRTLRLYGFINEFSRKLPLFLPTPLPPHTFSGLNLFDHRTHPLYGQTGLYVFMALLTKHHLLRAYDFLSGSTVYIYIYK